MDKILIVDDEVLNLREIVEMFEVYNKKYEIYQANDGETGYKIACDIQPDIIISDWYMVNDGIELVKKIRSNEIIGDTPLLIYSSILTSVDNLVVALEAGANDFLNKPFEPAELLARTNSMLQLSKGRKRIRELALMKEYMFNLMTHDLRNTLCSLINTIDILSNESFSLDVDEEVKLVSSVRKEVDKSYFGLEQMVTWVKSQMGSLSVNSNVIDLFYKVQCVINDLESDALEAGVRLINNVQMNLEVSFDQVMITCVLKNLIKNSIKFTPTGGEIYVMSQMFNQYVEIIVKDNGIGIEKKKLDHLNNGVLAGSTYGVRGERGNGIGLVLCKELLRLNSGGIEIESQVNVGTVVKVKILKG